MKSRIDDDCRSRDLVEISLSHYIEIRKVNVKCFNKVLIRENRSGIALKLLNVGVVKFIEIIESGGTRVHISMSI
jgi:hypothetical protein